MNTKTTTPNLYWNGGLFRVDVRLPDPIKKKGRTAKAIKILEDFRGVCQRHYFAYYFTLVGLLAQSNRHAELHNADYNNSKIAIGFGSPEDPQLPGKSIIGQMRQGELSQCLKVGGEFENNLAKFFVVVTYHLWDEKYRQSIARVLSVNSKRVECELMGDLRIIRNIIIHNDSAITTKHLRKLEFLPGIWSLHQGNLVISQNMMHSLIEQLNAIRLTVSPA